MLIQLSQIANRWVFRWRQKAECDWMVLMWTYRDHSIILSTMNELMCQDNNSVFLLKCHYLQSTAVYWPVQWFQELHRWRWGPQSYWSCRRYWCDDGRGKAERPPVVSAALCQLHQLVWKTRKRPQRLYSLYNKKKNLLITTLKWTLTRSKNWNSKLNYK